MRKTLIAGLLTAVVCAPAHAFTITTDATYTHAGALQLSDPKIGPPPGILVSEISPAGGFSIDFSDDARARAVNAGGITAVEANGVFANPDPINSNQIDRLSASATFSETVTNNGAGNEDFFYDFSIVGPLLELGDYAGASAGQPGAPTASYSVRIDVDGVPVFESAATLNGGLNGTTLTKIGTQFGDNYVPNAQQVIFQDFADSLFLGNFASGDSFVFDVAISVETHAYPFELGALARIGDPGNINSPTGLAGTLRSVGGSTPPTTGAPEPTTLALLGLGLVGLGWKSRRAR